MKVHLSLPAADLDATRAFYEALFGAPPVKVRHDYLKFDPEGLPLNISFVLADRPAEPGHRGIEVADSTLLDAIHDRMQIVGGITKPRETGVCCYADQDKFWVTDPLGHRWEVYQLVSDATDAVSAAPAAGNGCCASQRTNDGGGDACCPS